MFLKILLKYVPPNFHENGLFSNYSRSEIEEQGDVRVMDIRGVILTAHYINMGSLLSSSSLYLSVGAPRQRIHITTSTRHPTVSIVMKILIS